jgi:hypothetical protein
MLSDKAAEFVEASLADDLLRGAKEIAIEVFGDETRESLRKVYYYSSPAVPADCRSPVFRLGNLICARRSRLRRLGADHGDAA